MSSRQEVEQQTKQHDVVLRSRKEVEKLAHQHGKDTVATNKPDSQKTTPRSQAPSFSISHNNGRADKGNTIVLQITLPSSESSSSSKPKLFKRYDYTKA